MKKLKIIIVGNAGVGKTAMVAHLAGNHIPNCYIPTKEKEITELVGKGITVRLWDLAGDENVRTLTSAWYFDAQGAIIAYSMIDSDSLRNVKDWLANIERTVPPESFANMPKVIVGLKSDCDKLSITKEYGEKVARNLGYKHFIGTIKKKESFSDMFKELMKDVLQPKQVAQRENFPKQEVITDEKSALLKNKRNAEKKQKETETPSICNCGCKMM